MKAPYPMLWFDEEAEEAAELYVSLLPNSSILGVTHHPEGLSKAAGSVLTVDFELCGRRFVALNGGPEFEHSPAISLVIECQDQAEIDELWDALTAGGGEPSMCGWLVDRFGVSWQIVPENIGELIGHPAALQAMLQMSKLEIAELRAAAG